MNLVRDIKKMGLSNAKKRERKKFRIWRNRNNVRYCNECGKRLDHETHHFLCNGCWIKKKELKKLNNKIMRLKKCQKY